MDMDNNCAVCPFCGQSFYTNAVTEEGKRISAIKECDCWEARREREKWQYIENAKSELKDIFKMQFFGEEEPVYSEKLEVIENKIASLFVHMVELDVTSVTAKICDIGKITMSVNADGEIKIKRVVSSSVERKVQT